MYKYFLVLFALLFLLVSSVGCSKESKEANQMEKMVKESVVIAEKMAKEAFDVTEHSDPEVISVEETKNPEIVEEIEREPLTVEEIREQLEESGIVMYNVGDAALTTGNQGEILEIKVVRIRWREGERIKTNEMIDFIFKVNRREDGHPPRTFSFSASIFIGDHKETIESTAKSYHSVLNSHATFNVNELKRQGLHLEGNPFTVVLNDNAAFIIMPENIDFLVER